MTNIAPPPMPEHIEKMNQESVELQKELLVLAEKYMPKVGPDVTIMAFATITGKLLNWPNFDIKKARLKTIIKQKIGLM